MNNIFLGANDPLLYNGYPNQYQQTINDKIEQQKYEYAVRSRQYPDKLNELDERMKNLSPAAVKYLENDFEFNDLSATLQSTIQAELMNLVRQQINYNPEAVKNIERQLLLIKSAESKTQAEEKKNMEELNEYIKNYSNMTFDEYKKLKAEVYDN